VQDVTGEYITLIAFPELKDAMPYAMALSEAGIEHRVAEQFTEFDPTFAGNRRMDQVRVEVLLSEHEVALRIIENIDAGADLRVLRDTTSSKRGSTGLWIASTVVLLLSTLYFANRSDNAAETQLISDPLFYYNQTSTSVEVFRKGDQMLVSEDLDEDGNGIFEKGEIYDRNGELNSMWFDLDQDGSIDEWRMYDRLGRWATTSLDRNGDGYFEVFIEHRAEGDIEYNDVNGDGFFDPEEVVNN